MRLTVLVIVYDLVDVFGGPAGDFGNALGVVKGRDVVFDAERLAVA